MDLDQCPRSVYQWQHSAEGMLCNGCNFNHPGIPKKKVADRPWEKKDLKPKN